MNITVNTDGGARGNPGPAACAFVAKDSEGNILEKRGKYLGIATNNVAEYAGVQLALEWVLEEGSRKFERINFVLDSNLVVNQLNGDFKIKNIDLKALFSKIKDLEKQISVPVSYSHVLRDKNFEADKLVNETLDLQR